MSIETLKLVNQRLKPIDRRIRQLMRIGTITKVTGAMLDIQFSDVEKVTAVPYISINGLHLGPKEGDLVLVYSADGRIEQSVAIGIVKTAGENDAGVTSLSTLGPILSDLSSAVKAISSPGFFTCPSGAVVPGGPKVIETKDFK